MGLTRFAWIITQRLRRLMFKTTVSDTVLYRRKFIQNNIELSGKAVLEIGALTTPTYPSETVNIRHLDRFARDELRELYRGTSEINVEDIVDIDYAVKDRLFSGFVDEKFDLIIANHVIEHVPDPITWIRELKKMLKSEGSIFLSVPDKRYTFDILRPDTTAVDLLRCHDENLEKPTYYQILSGVYYYRPIRGSDVWLGKAAEKIKAKPMPMAEAIAAALGDKDSYSGGIHCHVFSRETFPDVWADLVESGLIELDIADISDVRRGFNEFHVLLRRSS